jgi:hypothetical protein
MDVHTGLGPPGVDTIMQFVAPGGNEAFIREFTVSTLGDAEDESGTVQYILSDARVPGNAAFGYDLMKGSCAGYMPAMKHAAAARGAGGWTRGLYYAQEFGTVSDHMVRSFVRDNAAFMHGGPPEELAAVARANESSFYMRTQQWKADIIRRGGAVLRQMQAALHQRHVELPEVAPDMLLI